MKLSRRILVSGAVACLGVGWADLSAAQTLSGGRGAIAPAGNFERGRSVSVRQRPHEGYDPIGVRMGSFVAWPKITGSVERNDNIYAAPSNTRDDTIWRVAPDLRLSSDWTRHALELYARGTVNRYSDFETENNQDYSVGANGRIDIQRGFTLAGSGSWSHLVEPRTSTNTAVTSVDPIEYDLSNVNATLSKEFNRLRLSGRVDFSKYDYQDGRSVTGAAIEQDDRDRSIQVFTGRGDYAISPDTALFLELGANKRDYRLEPPAVTVTRNSDGYTALLGSNFEITAVARGEIGVGYVSQSYDSPAFKKIDGFGGRALVEWFPTELTTITLNASRSIEDSSIPGDAGYIASAASLQLDHELLRNVILTAQFGAGKDEHKGVTPREDKRWNFGLSGAYLMNRNIGLNLSYSYLDQDSNISTFSFKQNKISAGVTLQF